MAPVKQHQGWFMWKILDVIWALMSPFSEGPSIESEGLSGELTEIIGCRRLERCVVISPGVDQSRRVDDQASMFAGAVIKGW